jgi:hypothetical protein
MGPNQFTLTILAFEKKKTLNSFLNTILLCSLTKTLLIRGRGKPKRGGEALLQMDDGHEINTNIFVHFLKF